MKVGRLPQHRIIYTAIYMVLNLDDDNMSKTERVSMMSIKGYRYLANCSSEFLYKTMPDTTNVQIVKLRLIVSV